jgi:hypothetical protein
MIDTRDLYKLPWTREDNPNGWIEPTTHCQLKCPFCYRGADQDGFVGVHQRLNDVKNEIDELILRRRVHTVTIAGGEPLMYPHLDETIGYIRSKDVEVMILTNGVRLDEAMVRRLKGRGVKRIVVHIDKHQGRPGITTEEEANVLRQEHCDTFRKVGGIALGFIQPISVEDIDDLEVLLPFFKRNADVVDLVTLNRLRPLDFDEYSDDEILQARTLFERVKEIYGLEQYSAYLGKTRSDEIAWLFGLGVFSGGHFQEYNYRRTGRHVYCTNEPLMKAHRLYSYIPFNRSLRKIAYRHLTSNGRNGHGVNGNGNGNGNGKVTKQYILLINTPRRLEDGGYDMCKGCPDAILHEGKLVPSCMLELIKDGLEIEAG